MLREFTPQDLEELMEIWLTTNLSAHSFISQEYWQQNYQAVKEQLPQARIIVYEEKGTIQGFIGIMDNHVAGLFVRSLSQSKGIGKKLLDFVKNEKQELTLQVYEKNQGALNFYLRENFTVLEKNINTNTQQRELTLHWQANLNKI